MHLYFSFERSFVILEDSGFEELGGGGGWRFDDTYGFDAWSFGMKNCVVLCWWLRDGQRTWDIKKSEILHIKVAIEHFIFSVNNFQVS